MVANDALSRLYGAVIDTLERQLSEMSFFQSDDTRATVVDEVVDTWRDSYLKWHFSKATRPGPQ